MSSKKTYVYNEYSKTIRRYPENYWVCCVEGDYLVFNDYDSKIKLWDKIKVFFLWYTDRIKIK